MTTHAYAIPAYARFILTSSRIQQIERSPYICWNSTIWNNTTDSPGEPSLTDRVGASAPFTTPVPLPRVCSEDDICPILRCTVGKYAELPLYFLDLESEQGLVLFRQAVGSSLPPCIRPQKSPMNQVFRFFAGLYGIRKIAVGPHGVPLAFEADQHPVSAVFQGISPRKPLVLSLRYLRFSSHSTQVPSTRYSRVGMACWASCFRQPQLRLLP